MTVIAGFLEILADWVLDKLLRGVAGKLFPTRELTSSLQAISDFTEGRLDQRTAEMAILGHIPRAELDLLRRSLEDNRGTLVIGEGGTGKTGIATVCACELIEKGHPVLYLRVDVLPRMITNPDEMGAHIGITGPFIHTLRSIVRAKGRCYLFFDQLGVVLGTDLSRTVCTLAQTLARIEGIHVLVVSRTYQSESAEIQDLDFPKVVVRPIDPELVRDQLHRLGIAHPSEALLALAENMLNLSLIAELVELDTDVGRVDGEPELWARYVESIREREGTDVLKKALELAASSLQTGRRNVPIIVADFPTQALIGRGVLVKANGDMFRFRHESLQDYLYAWEATRQRMTVSDVLADIDPAVAPGVVQWMFWIYLQEAPELAVQFAEEVFSG